MRSPTGTSARSDPTTDAGQLTAAWTVQALRSVWNRQRGRVDQRIDVIETAVVALENGTLETDLKEDAERAAHMLAGSLGMFGFRGASSAARELEAGLANPRSDRTTVLSEPLRRLRSGVRGPIVLCAEGT